MSELEGAVQKGDLERVRKLLDEGADVDERDTGGRTRLHRAAREGHTETAALLRQYGGVE